MYLVSYFNRMTNTLKACGIAPKCDTSCLASQRYNTQRDK